MDRENPYASPAEISDHSFDDERNCWRDGDLLVVILKTQMPSRCVFCNAPSHATFAFDAARWFALGKRIVRPGICPSHGRRLRRTRFIRFAFLLLNLMLVWFIYFYVPLGGSVAIWLKAIYLCVMVVLPILPLTSVTRKRIDGQFVWLRGASPAFLDGLPEWKK